MQASGELKGNPPSLLFKLQTLNKENISTKMACLVKAKQTSYEREFPVNLTLLSFTFNISNERKSFAKERKYINGETHFLL